MYLLKFCIQKQNVELFFSFSLMDTKNKIYIYLSEQSHVQQCI